jgi:hypothetical protein
MEPFTFKLLKSGHSAFLKKRGFQKVKFVSRDEDPSLAIFIGTLDQALQEHDTGRLLMLSELIRSMIHPGWNEAVKRLLTNFADSVREGTITQPALYNTKRLTQPLSPIVNLAKTLSDKMQRRVPVFDNSEYIMEIIVKLKVNLVVFSYYQGYFSETSYDNEGPRISVLKVVEKDMVELFCLSQDYDQPSKPKQSVVVNSPDLSQDHETSFEQCVQCKTRGSITKAVCKCLFCELCNPIAEVCKACSGKPNSCRLEENTPRFLRDFDPVCTNLCVCRHCLVAKNLTECPICNPPADLADLAKPNLAEADRGSSCGMCRAKTRLTKDVCDSSCTLCEDCLLRSVNGSGNCDLCHRPISDAALEIAERLG